jgi:molecular chaperone Hsp33
MTRTALQTFGDLVQPFQIEALGIRGRLVRLGDSLDTAIKAHGYPPAVVGLLAETMTLAVTLSAALKYEGVFILQAEGDGPVKMLVADVTSEGGLRGYARFDEDQVMAAEGGGGGAVPRLLGAGHLAFTVDQGPDTERYQGITELVGATIAECAQAYFRQSEQLETAISLCAAPMSAGDPPRAAALVVQRLPSGEEGTIARDEDDEAWRRAVVLMSSITAGELLDPDLTPSEILYRLYHEDGVRVYRQKTIEHACRCSRERVARTLASFPRDEIDAMSEDGQVAVTCEFCMAEYVFDDGQLDGLFSQ